MSKLFGTDGIRGIYGEYPITQEIAFKLGRSIVDFCENRENPTSIIVGRDTRGSGKVLEYALVSGIVSAGGIAKIAGIVPTPCVAFLTRSLNAGAGIVLSASHNPYEYNGFKVFSEKGFKLSVNEENDIEEMILNGNSASTGSDPGQADIVEETGENYINFIGRECG